MYHYVRNNEEFEYNVFSRKKEEFFQQVSYLKKKIHPCSISDKDEIDYYLKNIPTKEVTVKKLFYDNK